MRNGLYLFRHGLRLNQTQIAEKIGCSRATYSAIERGTRNGALTFWRKLQAAFGIPDEKIGALMRVDEAEPKAEK